MAYNLFTFDSVREQFKLATDELTDLFCAVGGVEPTATLQAVLAENVPLALTFGSEKARSELMISPVLVEARRLANRRVSLFSGVEFNVAPELGLNGVCDFIVSLSTEQYVLRAPALMIVEAKKENIPGGFGQCIAEMVAARMFNQKAANGIETIYGAVSTGDNWRFLKLTGNTVQIDLQQYHISQISKLLGILLEIMLGGQQTQAVAA